MRNRVAILGLLVSLLVCASLAWGQPERFHAAYDIAVSLDTDAHSLVGTQRVHYTNNSDEAIETIVFALIANWGAEPNPYLHPALNDERYTHGFDPTWTRISHVRTEDGASIDHRYESIPPVLQTFSLKDGLLIVDLSTSLAPGDSISLDIAFETKFAQGALADNCVYDDTYVWRFGWNPIAIGSDPRGDAFELPAGDYRVQLTVPEDYTAFGGADRQEVAESAPELRTIVLSNDHPVRSVPLIIGRELASVGTTVDGVVIDAVYLPGGESYARIALSYAEEILHYHASHFGAFTGSRIVIAENPTPGFFGMAADGLILVGASCVRLKDMPALGTYDRINEYLLAHELAHLWWGIGIGTDFNAENWISEGFAEYLSISYFEDKYGAFDPNLLSHLQPGLIEDLVTDSFGYLNLRQHLSELQYITLLGLGFDEPIIQPMSESDYVNGITIRTYNKGYLVLRGLEAILSEETLHRVLVEAHAQWNGSILSVEAFQRLAEEISGEALTAFFDGWLYGDARLDIAVTGYTSERTDDGYLTLVQLEGGDPVFPITLQATLEDGTTQQMSFRPTCCSVVAPPIESPLPVIAVSADPDERLPDANRYNNHWPRKIHVSHPFQGDAAPEIGLPLDAYVLDISPSGISGSFRNDHAWSVIVMPHVDPELDWETAEWSDFNAKLDVLGVASASFGRHLSLSFTGLVTALDPTVGTGELDLLLSAQVFGFTHPETGMAGRYWFPSWRSTLSFGLFGDLTAPIPYLSLSVLRDEQPSQLLMNQLSLQLGVPGFGTEPFGTVTWSLVGRLRLAHLFYLDATVSLSETLLADLPDEFLFSLDALHSFDHLPMGHHQQYGKLHVVLPPIVRDSGYAILNLSRVDSMIPSLFIQGGRTQADCETVCEPGIRVEAGASLSISFAGPLGVSLRFSIGYAHPLVGLDGEGTVFIDFGSAF